MKQRKRGTLAIMESILRSLQKGPQLKTHVAYNSKLDSRTISRYVSVLLDMRLVKKTASRKYAITTKGRDFLKERAKLKKYGV